MDYKKVLSRKDGVKYIIIPKNSEIKAGDTVKIILVKEDNNDKGN